MLHFVSFILEAAFILTTSTKIEYCPAIYWDAEVRNCSSVIYKQSRTTNESTLFCVQTELRCSTINSSKLNATDLRCRNVQESLWFEFTSPGYRNAVSGVNFSICRTWSIPEACSFHGWTGPVTPVTEWHLLVESESVPNPAFSMEDCGCRPYWEYADAQWDICYDRSTAETLTGVRVLVIVGLTALAVLGCVAFSFKFKKGFVRVDAVQVKA